MGDGEFHKKDGQEKSPGFLRRLASIFYDLLLLLALMAVATAVITLPLGLPSGGWFFLYQFFIFEIIPLVFFTGFWSWGGQTLGMRAWRMKLVREDGSQVAWNDALRRHIAALFSCLTFGLGFLWALIDRQGLTWHDHLSKTRLVLLK
ncbi:MAG: RDD family protein [Candidatus Thiodiazotropha sp. (ex Monitilora ramsayi)]|nr:RDD family protein [Candidatus Thiodiazotropha sp. (ex Monitilora ramsayi)]